MSDDLKDVPLDDVNDIRRLVANRIKISSYIPIALLIKNTSSSSVRNLYVELYISVDSNNVEITTSPPGSVGLWSSSMLTFQWNSLLGEGSEVVSKARQTFSRFESDLQKDETKEIWKMSFEWEALQPKRERIVKPIVYISAFETTKVTINAKVFSDFSPEPIELQAKIDLLVRPLAADLKTLMPDWADKLRAERAAMLQGNSGLLGTFAGHE
jgi:hypothetical protein